VLKNVKAGHTLKATTDQVSVPTYAPDLGRWTLEFAQLGASGLFHATNDDGVSRFEWTRLILEEAREAGLRLPKVAVEPVTSDYFNPTMRRPGYTVLDNHKAARVLGHPPGSWRIGLKTMLPGLARYLELI
jgi:dTDP-4-dehydrorhamnose reductase